MIELITTNHFDTIMDMFEGADKTIDIISPFLTKGMAKHLCSVVNLEIFITFAGNVQYKALLNRI